MSILWNALSSLDYGTGGKIIDDIIDGGDFDWSNVGQFGMNSLSNFIGGQNAKQEQLEAEQRENAEYDRRVADERAYNDPSAQAQRLSEAGINPLSVMSGSSVASGNTTTAGAPNNSHSAMSDMLAFQQLQNETKIANATVAEKEANIKRLNSEVDNLDWDTALKSQLYNFNADMQPKLLRQADQNINLAVANYKKVMADAEKSEAEKKLALENVQKVYAEKMLLVARANTEYYRTEYEKKNIEKLQQDLETGEWLKKSAEFESKLKEKQYDISKIEAMIKKKEWEDFWKLGLFRDIKQAEKKRIESLATSAEFTAMIAEGGIADIEKSGNFARAFYLLLSMVDSSLIGSIL